MLRAAVAVIVGGYAFWGIGSGLGHPPAIFAARLTAAVRPAVESASLAVVRPVKKALPRHGMKTVEYAGYVASVPANWPVYNLDKHPDQCVRYDVNAVYLGTPGPNQNCPPHLIGRAGTISIGDPARKDELAGPVGHKTPAKADQRALVQGQPAGQTPFAPGTIVQDANLHEFALAMPEFAPWIDATYGTDPGLIEQMLASVRHVTPQSAAESSTPASPKPPASAQANNPAGPTDPSPPTQADGGWPSGALGATAPNPNPSPQPSPSGPVLADKASPSAPPSPSPSPSMTQAVPKGAMAGFDTCTAPSLPTMKAWRAKYSATAIYIGGQMMGCGYGNLSASWVQQAEAMGWSLLPTYVGLQAPCDSFSGKINPKQAAAQGAAAASQAIVDASAFGLGAGSPVYYDMEAYDHTNASCRTAVLTFLDAWTRQLNASGYLSGVYSSADAAIIDLQSTTTIAGHPLAEPQAIWFALWDNATNLTGSPYLTPCVWPTSARSKQYAGNRLVKVGGISLEIDIDLVNSAVAHR